MRADSVHGCIGKRMKKCEEIITFDDFVQLCSQAGKNIRPIVMTPQDFTNFVDGHRQRGKNVEIPQLSQVCTVMFRKGSRSFWFKTSFQDAEFKECNFLRPRFNLASPPTARESARGISTKKKEGILKLIKHKFWADLPVNDSSRDLVHEFQ